MLQALEHGRLLEEIPWRFEVLTPLHAGSGEELHLGLDVESEAGWTFAIDLEKLFERLSPRDRERVGVDPLGVFYRGPLREVQRYALRGVLRGSRFPDGAVKLRGFARDAFGRPYLPGSTLKGALRTALLATRAEQDPDVRRAIRTAAMPQRRADPKRADQDAQQAAFRLNGSESSTDDVLRHLHVPDVLIPPRRLEVVGVRIASMDEEWGWGWKQRGRENARDPEDRQVLVSFVEAVSAGTVLRVPLRIDAQRLRADWLPGGRGRKGWQDFSGWRELLTGEGVLAAARAHGERLLPAEVTLWRQARPHGAAEKGMAGVERRWQASEKEAVFPVGWGIGWRGMTGAALEWLSEDGEARARDANREDPRLLRTARGAYPLGKREVDVFPTFPKSRRLGRTGAGGAELALPMGWVAARGWKDGDKATAFEAVRPPEARAAGRVAEGRRGAAVGVVAVRAVGPKAGEKVRGKLLEEKSRKGKWRAKIAGGAVGVIDGEVPEGVVAGQEVEVEVRSTGMAGQDWGFSWGKKMG